MEDIVNNDDEQFAKQREPLEFETVQERKLREGIAYAKAEGAALAAAEEAADGENQDIPEFVQQCEYVMRRMFGILEAIPLVDRETNRPAYHAPDMVAAASQVAQVYLNAAHSLMEYEFNLTQVEQRDAMIAESMRAEAIAREAAKQAGIYVPHLAPIQ